LSALEVIRMLTGPAIGIEKINPASNPAIDMVIILSITKILVSIAKRQENLHKIKDNSSQFLQIRYF